MLECLLQGGGDGSSDDESDDGTGSFGRKGSKVPSRAVQMLQARAQQAAGSSSSGGGVKRKGRSNDDSDDDDEDGASGGGGKRLAKGPSDSPSTGASHQSQTMTSPGAASTTGSSQSAAAAGGGGGGISEREVRAVLEQANGRMPFVDLKKRFKKRIKASETARKEFVAVLQHLIVFQEDEVEGRMCVLKGRQFS